MSVLHFRCVVDPASKTYLRALLKSSFSSSSSQLSSHKCVVPPGTVASSCVQSVNDHVISICYGHLLYCEFISPSTGKSSNSSSSSSKAGACFTGFDACAGSASCVLVGSSFAVGAEEDMMVECYGRVATDYVGGRRVDSRCFGSIRIGNLSLLVDFSCSLVIN